MADSPEQQTAAERRARLAQARAARARRAGGTGLLLITSGIALWGAVFLVLVVLWLAGADLGNWPGAAGLVVTAVSLALVTRGRRLRVGAAEAMLAGEAAPVVYLRPFGADGAEIARRMSSRSRIPPSGRFVTTYEERLARALRAIGPFVAVGDPAEHLPQLGAARTYAADEEWQVRVGDLIGRASVVLLHAGEGTGLAWEVRRVIDHGAPERTVLSLPLEARRGQPSRQQRYDAFCSRFGGAFPRRLPETIRHCQFAYFDADWTPRLLGARGTPLPDAEDERTRALRRLAREFKVAWGPLWARCVVYFAAFIGLLAALEAVLGSAS